jgi:hypothetical protein
LCTPDEFKGLEKEAETRDKTKAKTKTENTTLRRHREGWGTRQDGAASGRRGECGWHGEGGGSAGNRHEEPKATRPTRLIYALSAMISENRIVFVVVVTIIAVHFVLREATFEKAAIRKGGVRFPAGRGLRAIFWVGAPLELFVPMSFLVKSTSLQIGPFR